MVNERRREGKGLACARKEIILRVKLSVEQLSNGQHDMVIAICTLHALPRERGEEPKKIIGNCHA